MSIEAMKLELENMDVALWRARAAAVRTSHDHIQIGHAIDAFGRLKKAIAEAEKQEQGESVAKPTVEMLAVFKEAWKGGSIWTDRVTFALSEVFRTSKLYTTPQQRKPLTDEQCDNLAAEIMDAVAKEKGLDHAMHLNCDIATQTTLRRAIVRAAHGIKEQE